MNRSMVQRQSVGGFSGREFIFTKYPVTARKLTHSFPRPRRKDVLLHPVSELEDLKVLKRSPDLLNNVKIGQGQLQLIMEQILFLPYTFWSSDINNLMNNPSNSPVISEKKMFR